MQILLIALGLGIACYVAFVIMFPKTVPEDSSDHLKTALNRLYEENRSSENNPTNILRDQLSEEPPLVRIIFSSPLMRPMYEAGLQAGYQSDLKQLLLFMLAAFGIAFVLLFAGGAAGMTLPGALILGYYIPYKHCLRSVKKRNRKFIDQFPDSLDMIVRSVRSGFPLSVAMQMLAENAESPVREEFRQVVDEIALGRSLSQSLGRMATRINESDIRFFVVVLSVQQETGGNLAEIIGNLSTIIRKRKQLRHKIKAMTSEGVATGWVLGMLPVFVFAILYFFQPGYLQPLFTEALGQQILGGTVALLVICFVIVKNMINIEI